MNRTMNHAKAFKIRFLSVLFLNFFSYSIIAMDKGLYPHDYQCYKSHLNATYRIEYTGHTNPKKLDIAGEHYVLTDEENRNFRQFDDGKAPLVLALPSYGISQEAESLKNIIYQELAKFRKELGIPLSASQKNNIYWQQLKERIQNPPADQIKVWHDRIQQFPLLLQALEKYALTSNVCYALKSNQFKEVLTQVLAESIDITLWGRLTPFIDKLDEKNALLAQKDAIIEQKEITIAHKQKQKQKMRAELDAQNAQLREVRNAQAQFLVARDSFAQEKNEIEAHYTALLQQTKNELNEQTNRAAHLKQLLQTAYQELEYRRAQSPERRQQLKQKEEENASLRAQLEALKKVS